MNDPYSILGVSREASDDEVKAAYRELAKKYHPDNYANNPLADLAAEKMKEINEAYDTIMKMRREGGAGGVHSDGYSGYHGGGSGRFNNIREMINSGRLDEARQLLDAVPQNERDAEWYFLKGSVFYRNGWVNEAYTHYQQAVQMDPNNMEYREALNRISNQMGGNYGYGGGYGGYNRGGNSNGCNACDLCAGLACADCLCDGMTGC